MRNLTSKITVKYEPDRPLELPDWRAGKASPSDREMLSLVWIYRWGFATGEALERVCGRDNSALLVKKGLLAETRGIVPFIPKRFYTLTAAGLHLAEKMSPERIQYRFPEPQKLSQKLMRHDFLAQDLTLDGIESGLILDYVSPAILKKKYAAGAKVPDACWGLIDGNLHAVEVELNQKWERDLDRMIFEMIDSLQTNEYAKYVTFSQSKATIKNYTEATRAGAPLKNWRLDALGKWQVIEDLKVPKWLQDRVEFCLLDDKYRGR